MMFLIGAKTKKFLWLNPPLLLLASSVSVYVSPAQVPFAELMCLAFPVFFALCIVGLLLLCFFQKRLIITYLTLFLLNTPAILNYCPIHINSDKQGDLSVLSYNVNGFGKKPKLHSHVLRKFAEAFNNLGADIIFFQEGTWGNALACPLKDKYPFQDYTKTNDNHSVLGTFSKYPILSMEIIDTTAHNTCALVKILLAKGDTLNVVNCHLVSSGISEKSKTTNVVKQIMSAAALRANQVDKIATFLENNKCANLILLGDFNDTPISYVHQKFSNHLSDCYRHSGQGICRTYAGYSVPLRIDQMFCSKHWTPISCRVMNHVELSDHYPLLCTLKRKN